jgi:hypothetical protein
VGVSLLVPSRAARHRTTSSNARATVRRFDISPVRCFALPADEDLLTYPVRVEQGGVQMRGEDGG